ncbi:hypothetical protein KaCgl_00040 [Corynebacterium glutamicum]|nr:hypothetical protein KaCgl_00040 [Corynebacterium glutamicum]
MLMSASESRNPGLDGYVDWIVFDRDWNSFSEPCETEEEAQWSPNVRAASRSTGESGKGTLSCDNSYTVAISARQEALPK